MVKLIQQTKQQRKLHNAHINEHKKGEKNKIKIFVKNEIDLLVPHSL